MNSFFYRNLKRSYPVISSGEGVWLTDRDGRKYLDGCSGAVVSNIGHGVKELNQAIAKQLDAVAFAHSSQFVSEAALALSERLIGLAPASFNPGGRVYFVSGGSEAVETALKMARAFFVEKGETERHLVISRSASYHGSTRGALAVTGHPARRRPYLPLLSQSQQISPSYPYRCPCAAPGSCQSEACSKSLAAELEIAIQEAGQENVMAFIAEPVVGAALGAVIPHPRYFEYIREICDKYGILFVADEVMTGLGRIGPAFGMSVFAVEADIVALGKGVAAGYMPLGAVLASGKVAAAFENGSGVFEHGFTYSAHPVSCAAGLAVLEFMEAHKLFERINQSSVVLFEQLKQLAADPACAEIIGDVRGQGLLFGLEFVSDPLSKKIFAPELRLSQKIAEEASKLGLLIYPGGGCVDGGGDHIIVAPPYTMSESEQGELCQRLRSAIVNVIQALNSKVLQ